MREFACGDVVPGCASVVTGPDEDAVLARVAAHAVADHGLVTVPAVLVAQVRAATRPG
jgi:predicted small metal-binding protein